MGLSGVLRRASNLMETLRKAHVVSHTASPSRHSNHPKGMIAAWPHSIHRASGIAHFRRPANGGNSIKGGLKFLILAHPRITGFLPTETPWLALGNGRNGASGRVPAAEAERPLCVQLGDLRRDARQRARRADSRPSRPRPAMGRFDPKESFPYKETAYVK